MKKFLTLILALAMVLTLTACSKNAADIDDVVDYLEDEDFEYKYSDDEELYFDGMYLTGVEEVLAAYSDDIEMFFFGVFEDEDEAEDFFDELVDEAEDENFVSTSKSMGNYSHNEYMGDDWFFVLARVGDTVMFGRCEEENKDDLKEIFEDLGY